MQVIQKIKAKLNNSPRRVILDTRKKCSNNSTCRIIKHVDGQHNNPTRGRVASARRHGRGALTLALPRCGMPRVGIFYVATMLVPALAISMGFACLSCEAYAEQVGSSDVDFSLSVDATPSLEIVLDGDGLTTSPTSLGLNIKPNIDGTPVFGYSDLDVTVATSNATGYYLNFSTTNADGSLRTTSSSTLSTLADTGTFTCTTATASTCSFTTNRWGYKLAQDDATSYIAAPGSDGTKIDEIYTKTNGVTSNLRVGAKVDSSLTAGNYSTTMSFAATAHPTTYGIYYNYGAAEGTSPAPSGLPGNQSGALNNASTTTVTLSSDVPTWTGHTFNKWCLGTVNSTSYQNDTCTGTEYSAGDNIVFDINGDVSVTLKAMWNINTYTATIKTATGVSKVTLNGTECTSTSGCNVSNLIYGKGYSLVATLDTGYSLSTWSTTAGTIADNTASTTYTVGAGNATITPGATLDQYNVTVTFNTGANQVSFTNATYGTVTATASSPTVSLYYNQPYTATMSFSDNYEFDSWTAGTNTSVSSTGTNPTTVTLTGAGAGTLTATGKSSNFTITFKTSTASGINLCTETTSCTTYANNATLQLPSGTYTYTIYGAYGSRQGFSSWSTTSGGSVGSTSAPATTFTVSGATTLTLNGTTTSTAIQNLSSSSCTSTASLVYDNRDNQTYTIQRLADGNCWMMTNLNLGATTLSTDLTSSNTNLSDTVTASTFNAWNRATSGNSSSYTAPKFSPLNGADTTAAAPYGTLYNYCAASARTICTDYGSNSSDASYDLCPAGWRLPTSNTGGEFATLYANASYNTINKMRKSVANGGAAFALAGSFYYSTPSRQGTYGYYWSSTRSDSTKMYLLLLGTSDVKPSDHYDRDLGYSIRCILDDTLQGATYSSLLSKMPNVGDYTQLVDTRDGQLYTVAHFADGRFWMVDNLNLGTTDLTTNLTSANTNLSNTVTASTFNGWKKTSGSTTFTSAEFIPVSGTDSTSGTAYGTLYNYCAASAGTICTDSNSSNASYDLCPAGWRLPTSGSGGEFATLYANASYNTNAKMRASIANGGAAFALAGIFYSAPTAQGSGGYYWSSTRYSGTNMYYLLLNGTLSVDPSRNVDRNSGFSIRCILKATA